MRIITCLFLALATLALRLEAAPITGFNDITYWVGSGTNSSAFVVQWDDGNSPSSVVWGYRWNDASTPNVQTMMFDIAGDVTLNQTSGGPTPVQPPAGADGRLTITADAYSFGNFVSGIAYNQVGGGGDFSSTVRNQSGFGPNSELWTLYTIGTGANWPGSSVFASDFGMTAISLANNGWYGFAYTASFGPPPDFDPVSYSFAVPVSAIPEPSVGMLCLVGIAAVYFWRRREPQCRI